MCSSKPVFLELALYTTGYFKSNKRKQDAVTHHVISIPLFYIASTNGGALNVKYADLV